MWKKIRDGWAWKEWADDKNRDKPHILLHFYSASHKLPEALLKVIIKEKNGKERIIEKFNNLPEASRKIEELKKVL